MAQMRRKCRLADSAHRDVDLRQYEQLIVDTINSTVDGKNPKVFKEYFSTDPLTQTEAVLIGRAFAKVDVLKKYGKTITIFRLFDGKLYESENSNVHVKKSTVTDNTVTERKPKIKPLKGGRLR